VLEGWSNLKWIGKGQASKFVDQKDRQGDSNRGRECSLGSYSKIAKLISFYHAGV